MASPVTGDATAGYAQADTARFVEIVKRGGVILCSPDVYQALAREAERTSLEQFALVGAEIRVSHALPPGTFCAMEKANTQHSNRAPNDA